MPGDSHGAGRERLVYGGHCHRVVTLNPSERSGVSQWFAGARNWTRATCDAPTAYNGYLGLDALTRVMGLGKQPDLRQRAAGRLLLVWSATPKFYV